MTLISASVVDCGRESRDRSAERHQADAAQRRSPVGAPERARRSLWSQVPGVVGHVGRVGDLEDGDGRDREQERAADELAVAQRGSGDAVHDEDDRDDREDAHVEPRLVFHEAVDPVVAVDGKYGHHDGTDDDPQGQASRQHLGQALAAEHDVERRESDVHAPDQNENQ